jgi:putative hydrolase
LIDAPDLNARVADLLFDLSAVQSSKFRKSAYQGAAEAMLGLDAQIDALRTADGSLPKIPAIGPSSLRIVEEVMQSGGSPTAERAIADSSKAADVSARREHGMLGLSRARVRDVLADRDLDGPTTADYHGDFQMHSDWSDGRTTLEEMAAACADRGYLFSAITDHSLGPPIPRGLSPETMPKQREALAAINRKFAGRFRYLAGIEANIRPDGSLDVSPEDRAALDIVVASPHAKLRLAEDQTARMVTAVSSPGVHILGHPRGRVWGARTGIRADWDAVFGAAAKHQVAVELDGDPKRQDLDYAMAERALVAGCLFALDSDAHSPDQLPYSDFALAHARLAGIPRERIINCWTLEELLEWSKKRRANLFRRTTVI